MTPRHQQKRRSTPKTSKRLQARDPEPTTSHRVRVTVPARFSIPRMDVEQHYQRTMERHMREGEGPQRVQNVLQTATNNLSRTHQCDPSGIELAYDDGAGTQLKANVNGDGRLVIVPVG